MIGSFELLRGLEPNWDGQGAPAPAPAAIEAAREFAERMGISVLEVDADVLGGVAVIYVDDQGHRWWATFMNNGHQGTTRLTS